MTRNSELESENHILKEQVSYFQETFANSSLIGSNQTQAQPNYFVKREELENFKLDLLSKINKRFFDDTKSKSSTDESDIIQPPKIDKMVISNAMESLAAEDYQSTQKR